MRYFSTDTESMKNNVNKDMIDRFCPFYLFVTTECEGCQSRNSKPEYSCL